MTCAQLKGCVCCSGWYGHPFDEKNRRYEYNDIGIYVQIATIVNYCLQFVYNVQNGEGSFNPGNFRYFEYCFTCPFIVLDVCYSVELPHKVNAESLRTVPFSTGHS